MRIVCLKLNLYIISFQEGLTALHCAAVNGHDQVLDSLVRSGASLSLKTKTGLTPLHMALQGNQASCTRQLLQYNAPIGDTTEVSCLLCLFRHSSIITVVSIVSYLYIYITLLAMHTNQKRFQCEIPRDKRAVFVIIIIIILSGRKKTLGSLVSKVDRVQFIHSLRRFI